MILGDLTGVSLIDSLAAIAIEAASQMRRYMNIMSTRSCNHALEKPDKSH